MHKALTHGAFGWFVFTGSVDFLVDVLLQYLQGQRPPGPETTLYYGMDTSYALGLVLFGLLCLWLEWRGPTILNQ